MSDYSEYIAQIDLEIQAEKNVAEDVPRFPGPPAGFPDMRTEMEEAPSTPAENEPTHLEQFAEHVRFLESQQVLFYREITSYHKSVQKVVIFFKRAIRKLVRFLLEPMVAEIEQNRQATASALGEIYRYLTWQGKCTFSAQDREAELMDLRQENQMLQNRLNQVESEMWEQKRILNGLMKARGGAE